MEFEVASLRIRERTDVPDDVRIQTHLHHGWNVHDGRPKNFSVSFKTDKSTIEQVVGVGSEKQAVFSVQALVIV